MPMNLQDAEKELKNASIEDRMAYIGKFFEPGEIAFSSSFGQEDQAITYAIAQSNLGFRIFTLDTGRQFQETYELIDLTCKKYQIKLETYFPETEKVEELVKAKGFNSFYTSIENRKECCFIRKIEPLNRALVGTKVWITGLRAEQSENRANMPMFEWDESKQLVKFNPIIDWSFQQLENYLNTNSIPQNSLHKKGFISIGCAPCTRAITDGEHPRAGRWWWEQSQKECGLHKS